ncbi:hypothetical protein LEP1GSC077_3718 [Leptospira interrogans str. C10069]|nr:hypothetical protein LEP1GSC077_3718 [Leptospira interrogans str. C10069]EMN61233.1 hypothetical protein LEP1GSC092_3428 [Leptospira interrogans serovar Pyrogenes str. R168]
MQKVCFSDKENLPHPKIGKTQHNGSLRIALETQHNGSLRIALWELSFTEDFVVIPTIDLEIQLFVGLVMIKSVLLSLGNNV